jgi:hypothetical protein
MAIDSNDEIPYGTARRKSPATVASARSRPAKQKKIPRWPVTRWNLDGEVVRGVLMLAMVGGLVSFGIWAIVTNVENDRVTVVSCTERTELSTYRKSHTEYYECDDDDDGEMEECSHTTYTTEWRFTVHWDFVVNQTFQPFTTSEAWNIDNYWPAFPPDWAYPSWTHYENGSAITISHWRGTGSIISVSK